MEKQSAEKLASRSNVSGSVEKVHLHLQTAIWSDEQIMYTLIIILQFNFNWPTNDALVQKQLNIVRELNDPFHKNRTNRKVFIAFSISSFYAI